MSTRCNIGIKLNDSDKGKTITTKYGELYIPSDATYMSIYCHHDGYVAGVGHVLKNHYTTYEKIFDLIQKGDCTAIRQEEGWHYAGRGEEYEDNMPIFSQGLNDFPHEAYDYRFEDGRWLWFSQFGDDACWRVLTDEDIENDL